MQGSDHLFRSDRSHPVWWSGQCRAVQCSAVQCRAHHINTRRENFSEPVVAVVTTSAILVCCHFSYHKSRGASHPQHHQQPHYMYCTVVDKHDDRRGAVPLVASEAVSGRLRPPGSIRPFVNTIGGKIKLHDLTLLFRFSHSWHWPEVRLWLHTFL